MYGNHTVLNDDSSYIEGIAVPDLYDRHESKLSQKEEYSKDDAVTCTFKGIPAQLNHQGMKAHVGQVVGYKTGDSIEVLIEMPPSTEPMSVFGKNGLFYNYYNDLSLQHRWKLNEDGSVSKTAIEVSLCDQGAREGSHITQFYPSERLLNCQTHKSLSSFASRYNYTAPPSVGGTVSASSGANLTCADVKNTPELAAYVRNVLWPEVKARRHTLLKLSGYIAASRNHKSRIIAEMSNPASGTNQSASNQAQQSGTHSASATLVSGAPSVGAAIQAQAAQAMPALSTSPGAPIISTMTAMANNLKSPLGPSTTSASLTSPTPGAAVPGTPAPANEAAQQTSNAMAEDSAVDTNDRLAVLEKAHQVSMQKDQKIAELEEALVKASKEKEQEATERLFAEAKTKADLTIGNTDGWSEDTQKQMTGNFDMQLQAARKAGDMATQKMLVDAALEGVKACSKSAQDMMKNFQPQQQSLPSRAPTTASQWLSPREREIALSLTRFGISQKNSNQFGAFQPQVPFATSSAFSTPVKQEPLDDDEHAQQMMKRGAVATDTGVVAMSRSAAGNGATTTSPPLAAELTQSTPGWAGVCYTKSFEAQQGQPYITFPSYEDLKRGGITLVETGVVRKSRAADGSTIKVAEVSLQPRFQEEKSFGLKELNPQFHSDLINSVKTGMLHVGGKPKSLISFDNATMQNCNSIAKTAEREFATCRRVSVAPY